MGSSVGFYLVQYLLFIFNVIFLLAGVNLLGLSVWALLDKDYIEVFLQTHVFSVGVLTCICVSVTTIVITFFGCFGAIKSIRWLLVSFFVSLMVILSAILVAIILLFLYRHSLSQQLENVMTNSMKTKYLHKPKNSSSLAIRDTWDWMQQTLKCCGVGEHGSFDWQTTYWFLQLKGSYTTESNEEIPKVPKSCCIPADTVLDVSQKTTFLNYDKCLGIKSYAQFGGPPLTKIVTSQNNEGLYVTGCHSKIIALIGKTKVLVGIVGTFVGVISLLVIGMGLSCTLCRRLEEETLDETKASNY